MGEIVAKLMGTLWPKLQPDYEDVARKIIGREPKKRAEHRGSVLNVVDPALADLAAAEYGNDMLAIYWARSLGEPGRLRESRRTAQQRPSIAEGHL